MSNLPDGNEARRGVRNIPVVVTSSGDACLPWSLASEMPFRYNSSRGRIQESPGLVILLRSFERHVGEMRERAIAQREKFARQTAVRPR